MPYVYPASLSRIIDVLATLPGVGKRSAERLALAVTKWDEEKIASFAESISRIATDLTRCSLCGNFADADAPGKLCSICASPIRDRASVCVVEEPLQIRSIENAGVFKGLYHVLGGRIAPLDNVGPEDLKIEELLKRIDRGEIKEVIFALSPDVEGQATSVYIARAMKDRNVKISRLAQGLPAGSDLNYADPATVAAALNGRINF